MIARLITTAFLVVLSWQSSASYIEGQIDFTGSVSLTLTDDGSAVSDVTFNNVAVELATEDYAAFGVGPGDAVNYNSLDSSNLPLTSLWSTGGFSFDLISLAINTVLDLPIGHDIAVLQGNGMIQHADFEDTLGAWTFTTQTDGNSGWFSFSATVPEPAPLFLLFLGLVGLFVARRKNQEK